MLPWIERKLGRQMLFGYALVTVLFLLFGLYAYRSIHNMAQHTEHMVQHLSRSATLSVEIAHDASMLRRYAVGYVRGQKQEDLNAFVETGSRLKEKIQKTRQSLADRAYLSVLDRLDQSAARYEKVFEDMVRVIQDNQGLILKDLNHHKYLVEDALSALRVSLIASQDVTGVLLLERVARGFLEIQLNGLRFIETGDEKYFVLLGKARLDIEPQKAALRERFTKQNNMEVLESIEGGLQAYADALETIKANTRKLNAHMDELMGLETAVREDTAFMLKSLDHVFQTYLMESQRLAARTGLAVVVFALMAVLGGLLLGYLHTRRITQPLHRVMTTSQDLATKDIQCLIDQLQRLAQGRLDVDFSVTTQPLHMKRGDELGVMASAFDTVIQQFQEAQGAFQQMSRYLQRTASTAQQVAAGTLDVEVGLASETDALGIALSDMLKSLRHAEREMTKYQDFLEDQIQQRTQELEENRRMLWTLLANLQGMAYRCRDDPSWTMEFVSEGAAALTGYRAEELVGSKAVSYGELIHPEDRDLVWHTVQESLSQKQPFILLYRIRTKTDEEKWVWEKGRGIWSEQGNLLALEGFITDITVLKRLQQEREQLIKELQKALSEVKTLSGLLPICSSCKKIRDDQGYWEQLENYFRKHSEILFTHSICPECMKKLYPDIYEKLQREKASQES